MHELAIMKNIIQICTEKMEQAGKNRITRIELQVGALRNIEEPWMQQYFGYISPGTAAEGATVKIERIPLIFQCGDCGHKYTPNPRDPRTFPCAKCGSANYDMVSGRELIIHRMEIE